jgi:hypothetical protein
MASEGGVPLEDSSCTIFNRGCPNERDRVVERGEEARPDDTRELNTELAKDGFRDPEEFVLPLFEFKLSASNFVLS